MSNCSNAPNPSPINLSQATAQPCDILCDLVMDDAYATSGTVFSFSNGGVILTSNTNLGSCKFNGEGYSCQMLVVNHPSHHTIENIQADAELVAIFRNPTGKMLLVSSLIRVNPAETQSTNFLNKFIPYANSSGESTKVTLNNWSLSMMVPPNATFYSYQGSFWLESCSPAQVIVFGSMINIDSNAFALLVKNTKRTAVGIQPLGKREVFFNNGEQLPGPKMPNDGKIYMRLHPKKDDTDKKKSSKFVKPVNQVDVSTTHAAEQSKSGLFGGISKWTRDQASVNGWFSIVNVVLLLISFGAAVYFAYLYNDQLTTLLMLNDKAREFSRTIRALVMSTGSNLRASASSISLPRLSSAPPPPAA